MTEKLYLVWTDDGDCAYWSQFDTLEDAAGSLDGDPVEIYEATPKLLGKFETVTIARPIKKKK